MFRPKVLHFAFIGGVLVPAVLSAGVIAFLFRDDILRWFTPPPEQPKEEFVISEGGRTLFYPANNIILDVPERWHAEDPRKFTVALRTDFLGTQCSMYVAFGPNTGGESASSFLERFDLGPRLAGQEILEKEQGLIQVARWEAVFFWWKTKDLIRIREVSVVMGVYILSFSSWEDLNFLDRASTNCFDDFDTLVNSLRQG